MKKAVITDIKHFAVHDGDGIRTTVFFKGCPLRCVWCHNPEGISPKVQLAYYEHKCVSCGECVKSCPNGAHYIVDGKHSFDRTLCGMSDKCSEKCNFSALKTYGRYMTVQEVLDELLEDSMFYDVSGGGVTLSGGECMKYYEFCTELLKELKINNVNTAIDTCGYTSKEALDSVMDYTDVFLYDIKAFDEEVHIKYTGVSNKIILDNLVYLDKCGKQIEIRIPFVPDCNADQMEKIAEFLTKIENVVKVRILPYHNYAGTKYKALGFENSLPERIPLREEIIQVENVMKKRGINIACN